MKTRKPLLPFHLLMISLFISLHLQGIAQTPEIQIQKIWDAAPHNAFTDLVQFKGKFYCTFREGTGHVPGENGKDGEIRVIASADGKSWESVAHLTLENYDLRDPKLSITPKGELMLLMGATDYDGNIMRARLPHVSFSKNGTDFSAPTPVKIDPKISNKMDWLWRVTWHKKTGYGVVYQAFDEKFDAFLVKTKNGIDYQLVTPLDIDGKPNEATAQVMPDNEMVMIIRRESENQHGFIGKSKPPYKDWEWKDMDMRLGGPYFISLPNGRLLMGSRVYSPKGATTGLFLEKTNGDFYQIAEFPSGGDTSYPGIVLMNDTVYVSYYASHEGKTSIYFAPVPLSYITSMLTAPQVLSSEKIWDTAPHSAFTDLIRFQGKFFCTFREGNGHSPVHEPATNGVIRVIVSEDGKHWESAALIEEEGIDLRDPKLARMPDGRLMITCGGSDYSDNLQEWHTRVIYSKDGYEWTSPYRVRGIPTNNWFFRLTWHGDTGYVAPNICASDPETGRVITSDRQMAIYKTIDGMNYEKVTDLDFTKVPCEATIRFKNDAMVIVTRDCDGHPTRGWLGTAAPPYKAFNFRKIPHGMGGPNLKLLPNDTWLLATREYPDERPEGREGVATVFMRLDETGHFTRLFELPSGDDTSYPGLVIYDDKLWISYYSSHEGKTSIYFTSVPLSEVMKTSR